MKCMKVDTFLSRKEAKDEVRDLLLSGGAVVFPTDTLYGIAVDPGNGEAMDYLYRLKGREEAKGVPLLLDGEERLKEICGEIPPVGLSLSRRFWPGKLTIVLNPSNTDRIAWGGMKKSVGVRLPASRVARQVAAQCGGVITGTSANRSGGPLPLESGHIMKSYGEENMIFIDGGKLPPSRGSTVVRIDGDLVEVVREGDIGTDEILHFLEEMGNGEN